MESGAPPRSAASPAQVANTGNEVPPCQRNPMPKQMAAGAALFTKDLMARFLCWHIQEQAFGGLDPKTAKLLDALARGDKRAAVRPPPLKPGTVLLREYQGERHTVTVVPNGYVWRGRPTQASPPSRGTSPAQPGAVPASLGCAQRAPSTALPCKSSWPMSGLI